MTNQFTHRQDSNFSHTSICLKCFRFVATRERESELRVDEAVHSCKISLPGSKSDPTYWGILCRTCAALVAFGTIPAQNTDPGAEGSKPGTICCNKGHTHIYFPRDFRLYPSTVAIVGATIRENVGIYKAINPSWEFRDAPPGYRQFQRRETNPTLTRKHSTATCVPYALSPTRAERAPRRLL
jgi:hypothetical protein